MGALSLGEKGLKTFAPSLEEGSLAGGVVKQLRVVRRALRAIRHGGRREAGHADEEEKDVDLTSWKKWIINMLHINAILGIFGMSLDEDKEEEPVATSPKKTEVDETVDDETLAEKLEKDYGDESQDSQDPDYVPSNPTEEDSLEYKSDEEKLDASQEESQEELEASQETSQDVSQEDDTHEAAQVIPEDVVETQTEKAASAKSSPAASPEKTAEVVPEDVVEAETEKAPSAKSSPAASPEKAASAKSSPAASPEKAVSTKSSPAASPDKAVLYESVEVTEEASVESTEASPEEPVAS